MDFVSGMNIVVTYLVAVKLGSCIRFAINKDVSVLCVSCRLRLIQIVKGSMRTTSDTCISNDQCNLAKSPVHFAEKTARL